MDMLLVGSGPSAQYWHKAPKPDGLDRTQVAAVNAAPLLFPDISFVDYYGVFENTGVRMYMDLIKQMTKVAHVYVKHENIGTLHHAHIHDVAPEVRIVGEQFGPVPLQYLNPDQLYGRKERETWISSGVFMMWVMAHTFKPAVMYVCGLDGYQSNEDYAPDITGDIASAYFHATVPGERRIDEERKNELWRGRMNKHMALAIKEITNYYVDTKFVWLKKPNHDMTDWRVDLWE
jgi:hypothetical protein